MSDPLDVLEASIVALRRAIRDASEAGDAARVADLRAQLRRSERAWDVLIDSEPAQLTPVAAARPGTGGVPVMMLPAREQVHRALTLLQAPAAPKLIVDVYGAFFPGELPTAKLSSLRRDEERSYRSAPGGRPYYLCPALTYDTWSPARALVSISTWPLEQRMIGPLSPRVDFLTAAIRVAEAIRTAETTPAGPSPGALGLLWRFAANIPGALAPDSGGDDTGTPSEVIDAAQVELDQHADTDRATRSEAARRARKHLSDGQRLFGTAAGQARPTARTAH